MKVTKYFYEDNATLRFLAWMKERQNNKTITGFVQRDTIYNVLLPPNFDPPQFVEARKIEEKEEEQYTIKLWRFKRSLQKLSVPGMRVIHGFVVRKKPEQITCRIGRTRPTLRIIPESFSVLTTDDKRFCIATSFVSGITIRSFVEIIVDTDIEKEGKTSLRGVITRKLGPVEGLSVIKDEFGSLDEFFKNIDKKF